MKKTTQKVKAIEGRMIKLHNRRVRLYRLEDGSWGLSFKKLEDKEVTVTEVRLSEEALSALIDLYALMNQTGKSQRLLKMLTYSLAYKRAGV